MSDAAVLLVRGTVRHARLRPVEHAFVYPVQFMRVRADLLDSARLPWLFSYNRFNLFSIHDSDHGFNGQPIAQAISDNLRALGINDADGALWLHTFPRVLGFSFNPVSFWFCERREGTLRAIVCEVNNTFGDRHCYVIANDDGAALRQGQQHSAPKRMFVSPFNPVEGGYRFRLMNRAASGDPDAGRAVARIDYADAQGDILHTSISGTWEPATASALATAFLRAPLQALAVVLRIHWQALRLWCKRVPLLHHRVPDPRQPSQTLAQQVVP
jgi:DUF1365 family protein